MQGGTSPGWFWGPGCPSHRLPRLRGHHSFGICRGAARSHLTASSAAGEESALNWGISPKRSGLVLRRFPGLRSLPCPVCAWGVEGAWEKLGPLGHLAWLPTLLPAQWGRFQTSSSPAVPGPCDGVRTPCTGVRAAGCGDGVPPLREGPAWALPTTELLRAIRTLSLWTPPLRIP